MIDASFLKRIQSLTMGLHDSKHGAMSLTMKKKNPIIINLDHNQAI